MTCKPLVGRTFPGRHQVPDPIGQDLGPAAGNRIQAGRDQSADNRADTQTRNLAEMKNLRRGKTVYVNAARFYKSYQVFVILQLQIRMKPTLQQDLGSTEGQCFIDFLLQLRFVRSGTRQKIPGLLKKAQNLHAEIQISV